MPLTIDLVEELNTLIRFVPSSTQTGIKVHTTADPAVIAATGRLHAKGLLTQVDGGYLTDQGRDVAGHVQAALSVLSAPKKA